MIWTTRPRSDLSGGLTGFRAGSGPLMVLIHGVGLRAEAWNALAPLLTDHFTVLAVDMPGHGGSKPVAVAQLSAYTTRFAELLQIEGPAHVVGHSMGAMIALDLAAQHSTLVRGVGALNAIYRRAPKAAQAVADRAAALSASPAPDPAPTLSRWFADADCAQARACRDWLMASNGPGYATAYRTFAHHDGPADADLEGLHIPALFLTGADDPNSTPAMSQAMARRVPNGQAVVLADAAHMAPMTHPVPIAAALTRVLIPSNTKAR